MLVADIGLSGSATLTPFASYTHASLANGQIHRLGAGISLGVALSGKAGFFAQYFGITESDGQGKDTGWLVSGLTLLVRDNLQLDWHAGVALDNPAPTYFTGAGISTRFSLR